MWPMFKMRFRPRRGNPVSQVLQGEAVYNVVVRYQKPYRDTKEAIQNIRLLSPSGGRVSLAQVTKTRFTMDAYDIYREDGSVRGHTL